MTEQQCREKQSARRGRPGAELGVWSFGLEHAENDGADEGECDVRGHNAQLAQQRTREIHCETPLVHNAARINAKASKGFPREKVSAAVRVRVPSDDARLKQAPNQDVDGRENLFAGAREWGCVAAPALDPISHKYDCAVHQYDLELIR
ncbi:hypothetical protein [Bradyrhizobium sp. USDA 4454]